MKNYLKDSASWIPKEIFLVYCGDEDSKKLSNFYDQAVSKKNMMAFSFNWFAVLFFPAWLGFRKQWALLAVFTGMFALLPFLEVIFRFSFPNGAFVGFDIILGMQANGFLLNSAHRNYLKFKKENLETGTIIGKMRDQAKGSIVLALLSLATCIGIVFVFSYIADSFF